MKAKQFIPIILLGVFISFTSSCGGKKTKHDPEHNTDSTGHEHIYSCPMHPEVRGKEGEKCPKCNMMLEHMDEVTDNGKTYFMKLTSNPVEAEAKKPCKLSFTPTEKGNEGVLVPLDVEHEKKLHLIIVSEDLSFFDHQHPEYQSSGSYDLSYTFPFGGNFLMFADYKPTNASHIVDNIPFAAKGEAHKTVSFTKEKLEDTEGSYKVIIKTESGQITTGGTSHLEVTVMKNGKEMDANNLEDYLGAKAHVVTIGIADKNYLHVHPEVENGRLDLHTSFDKPGLFRAWVQFQDGGKVIITDFVLNVVQGNSTEGGEHNMENMEKKEDGHSHSH